MMTLADTNRLMVTLADTNRLMVIQSVSRGLVACVVLN